MLLPLLSGGSASSAAPMSDAEVAAELEAIATKAEIGYGKTVFEDPDNKCQHCHYKTHGDWAGSMHANSWSDPVFQFKYQAFLKTLMGKIGGTETTTSAGKKGLVCLTCHAPKAIYSNDVQLTFTQLTAAGTNSNHIDKTLAAPKTTDVNLPVTLAGVGSDGTTPYMAQFHVGNATNRKGISCSLCHSMENFHMVKTGDTYTSATASANLGTMTWNADPSAADMNKYYSITGPVVYTDYFIKGTPAAANVQTRDGRFDLKSIVADGTSYAGGPYYGPFGATGLTSDVSSDPWHDRSASASSTASSNFATKSKTLCMGCHQRSAGAADPINGGKMELCVTAHSSESGVDSELASTGSPKCASCHMEKRTGIVLNHWKREDLADSSHPGLPAGMKNLLNINAYSSHEWESGRSLDKLQASIETTVSLTGSDATVTLENKTSHYFPGAHPMRRVVLMVRAFDGSDVEITASSATGNSTFADVIFQYARPYMKYPIVVAIANTARYVVNGYVSDLTGAEVFNQRFGGTGWSTDGDNYTAAAGLKKRITENRSASPDLAATPYNSGFVRIFGRETWTDAAISIQNGFSEAIYDVTDGFLANTSNDNRLKANEKETYTVTFASAPARVEYRVYYLRFGPRLSSTPSTTDPANLGTDGWPIDGVAGVTLISSKTAVP